MKKIIAFLMKAHDAAILTTAELLVLLSIAQKNGKHTLVSLVEEIGTPQSSTSRVIWSLVEKGLVEQLPLAGDRRKRLLKINEAKFKAAFGDAV